MKKLSLKMALMVAVLSIFVASSIAWAATPRWSHLTLFSGDMDIANGMATITVVCDASSREADSVAATCSLQQLDGSWKTLKTWTESDDDTSLIYEKQYAVAHGYSYRLKVTAKAYKGSTLLESATEYFDYGYYK